MAIKFIEGFDIYGADETQMSDGVYLAMGLTLDNSVVRSGSYSVRHDMAAVGAKESRRGLGGEFTGIGMGFGLYISSMPDVSDIIRICDFRNDNNFVQLSVMLTSTGNIRVYRGCPDFFYNGVSGTALAATTDSPLVTEAWQHIEVQANFANSGGWYEIRVDGVTVLQQTGIDTIQDSSIPNVNSVACVGAYTNNTTGGSIYCDDWYCYDFSGTENNDWIGDRKVLALFPSDNGADQDWTPNGASAEHDCIDDTVADGDSTYIEAAATGLPLNANFEIDNLPGGVGAVTAVQTYVKAKKTDAAACNLQVSMQSSASESNGTNRPITTAYTYWMDVFELDPATGSLWSVSGLNSAKIDLERTL